MSSPRRPKARTDAAPLITSAGRRRTLGESFSDQDLQQAQAYDALRPTTRTPRSPRCWGAARC
ncbi:hypothetical protein [Nesterenkonia pannonica]|uniref:hypothetical protein n=1 Tax=Nesterenkonia pannonica TaxID=1548602 RepID=UPI002164BD87|nr:hypothetical protein [Nesterenkonia pannonica]